MFQLKWNVALEKSKRAKGARQVKLFGRYRPNLTFKTQAFSKDASDELTQGASVIQTEIVQQAPIYFQGLHESFAKAPICW